MAYMRGEYYIYATNEGVEFMTPDMVGILSHDKMEELAVMVFFRLVTSGRAREVIERVYDEYSGNFGADGVAAFLGEPTTMDMVRAMVPPEKT